MAPGPAYRHTQPGHVTRWASLGGALLLPIVWSTAEGRLPYLWPALACVLALMLGSAVFFWSMTVEVAEGRLCFWFGAGWMRSVYPLDVIESYERVGGLFAWGIHWGGKRGWLYNVSGRQALALRLKNGKAFMVGTDEPEALMRALDEARLGRP